MSARPWKLRVDGKIVPRASFASKEAAIAAATDEAAVTGTACEVVDFTNGEENEAILVEPPISADRQTVTNPACPCWSGYHFMHRPVCGCLLCEPGPRPPTTPPKQLVGRE